MMQHKARKRFGQNFLTDTTVIERIVHSINPQSCDKLVEIGPGLGALTCPLMKIMGELDVIELDRDIIPKLEMNCGLIGRLRIHNADVLRFDFTELCQDNQQLRIIGNLPYNISTPIIFHLVDYAKNIQDMHFMLQKEVVQRLAATPGNSEYGRLSIMAQLHFKISPLFLVPPEAFEPSPKVESAIVKLTPHQTKPVDIIDEKHFAQLIKLAFSQRRKTIRNTLKTICNDDDLKSAGIDPSQRPEQLGIEQFSALSNILSDNQ